MDPVLVTGDVVGVLTEGGSLDQRLDDRGDSRAQRVHREDAPVRGRVHRDEPRGVLERPAVGDVADGLGLADECRAALLQLGRSGAERGDLRVTEDRVRHRAPVVAPRRPGHQPGEVVGHDARLPVGDVLELVGRGDVTERPHALCRRALLVVDDDAAVLVGPDAARRGVEQVGVGSTAHGEQHHLGLHVARTVSTLELDAPGVAGARGSHGVAGEAHVVTPPGDLGVALRDLHLLHSQQVCRALHLRDVHAERREDVGQLARDEPTTDDRHPRRELLEAHHRVGGVHAPCGVGPSEPVDVQA